MYKYIQIDDIVAFIYADGTEFLAKVECKQDSLIAVDMWPLEEDGEKLAWINPSAASLKRIELVER